MGIHKMDVVVVVRSFNVIFVSRLFFAIRLPMYYVCSRHQLVILLAKEA